MAQDRPVFTDPSAYAARDPGSPAMPDTSAIYRGVSEVADAGMKIGLQLYQAQQESALMNARLSMADQFAKLRATAVAAPDPRETHRLFQEGAAQIQQSAQAWALDDRTSAHIGAEFESYRLQYDQQIAANVLQKTHSQLLAGWEKRKDQLFADGTVNPNPEMTSQKARIRLEIDGLKAAGVFGAAQAETEKQGALQAIDHKHAVRLIIENPKAALDLLESRLGRDGSGPYTDFVDLKEEDRFTLIYQAKQTIGGMRMSLSDLEAEATTNGIRHGLPLSQESYARLHNSGAYTPQEQERIDKLSTYSLQANNLFRRMQVSPKADQEAIMASGDLFSGGPDSTHKRQAEFALRSAMTELNDLREKDVALAADTYQPAPAGESEQARIARRVAYARQVGMGPAPFTNSELLNTVARATAPSLPGQDDGRASLWESIQGQLSGNRELTDAVYTGLRKQGMPAEFFALDPKNPALNAVILKSLEAKSGGYAGKDIPGEQKTAILKDVANSIDDVARAKGWPAAQTALWREAAENIALSLYNKEGDNAGSKAWKLLYADNFQSAGPAEVPKSWGLEKKAQVADVTVAIDRNLGFLPIDTGEFPPAEGTASLQSGGHWILSGTDTYQRLDSDGNLVLWKGGIPMQFRASDIPMFSKHNKDIAAKNAAGGWRTLFGLARRQPEWEIDLAKFEAYAKDLAQFEGRTVRTEVAPYSPEELRKPAVSEPIPKAKKR